MINDEDRVAVEFIKKKYANYIKREKLRKIDRDGDSDKEQHEHEYNEHNPNMIM